MAQCNFYLSAVALGLLGVAPALAAVPVRPPSGDVILTLDYTEQAAVPAPQAQRLQIQGGQIIINFPADFPPEPANPLPLPIVNDGFANDQDIPGPLTPLVKALRSQNYPEREAATRTLLRLPPSRLNDVVDTLAKEADSEAIARLTQVAGHLYLKPRTSVRMQNSLLGAWFKQPNPLGSSCMLGMKFKIEAVKLRPDDAEPTATVVATELQTGFPAMQTLINGDRIVSIDGKGFPVGLSEEDGTFFQKRVAELWPRAIVPMTILREGKLLDLQVQLAGMPGTGPMSIAEHIDARNTELTRFIASLKTGEKSQAALPAAAVPTPAARAPADVPPGDTPVLIEKARP